MKKLFDSEGRLFGKVSVIDICLVLLVVLLIFAFFGRQKKTEEVVVSSPDEPFSYEVKLRGLRDVSAASFRVGDEVFDNDTGTKLGVISKIEIDPAQSEVNTLEGKVKLIEVEDRYDLTLTIRSEGLVSDNRYFANGTYELSLNAPYSFYTKYVGGSAVVWRMLGPDSGEVTP